MYFQCGRSNINYLITSTSAFKLFVLIFSFHGQLWLIPEIKEVCPAFNRITKLSVRGIFVDFDILWTIAILEAAPSVEMLLIGVTSLVLVL
jgi:hypothetical protein